jgi:predicted ATPase
MIISHVKLKNWRNFREAEVDLGDRAFIVGPNASGKSNFLDVFRFLRDIAKSGGGLQKAIEDRGGISKVRCLAARKDPAVEIEVHIADSRNQQPQWMYSLSISQKPRGYRPTLIKHEKVYKNGELILDRPDIHDREDELRLTQTSLEQVNANLAFREVASYFESILYLHLIPQLLRYPKSFTGTDTSEDPFGRKFLERIAKTPEKTRKARLGKIEQALKIAVPQLTQLEYISDAIEGGIPHLETRYIHWRQSGARQREDQLSDGTLRLIGLLWSIMESDSLLLLEEPELSLHAAIVQKLPPLIHRLTRKKKRQIILSTHSADLLSDPGIAPEEVLILTPEKEGTVITPASSFEDVTALLEGGMTMAEATLPLAAPPQIEQLDFFE